jgi:CheY-like chemotaxis protein
MPQFAKYRGDRCVVISGRDGGRQTLGVQNARKKSRTQWREFFVCNLSSKKIHVLLAMRDGAQLKSYGDFLTREGFRVTIVASALACWTELEYERPDLLIIERELPWGRGDVSALARLDEEPETRGIPVIHFSKNSPSGVGYAAIFGGLMPAA